MEGETKKEVKEETKEVQEGKPSKKAIKKEEKAARKERWKKQKADMKSEKKAKKLAKKAKKLEKKNRYKDAPFLIKAWHKVIKKLLVTLVLISAACGVVYATYGEEIVLQLSYFVMNFAETHEVSDDEIQKLSPIDEEGDAEIQKMDKIGKDETWTICYYIVGSNLEDNDENDLSELTQTLTSGYIEENNRIGEENMQARIQNYMDELSSNGLDFPEYMYEPNYPSDSDEDEEESSSVAEGKGAASTDIEEICAEQWSENINIVIQTGGATRWSNSQINPNKTQRFEYVDGKFTEVENMPLQDSCDPDTLADFMSYCDENYPSDHKMLVLWDHGGGAFGYGIDDIYGSGVMSLKDIESAFAKNYEADAENPHYDIIGFDACLMASTEVAHSLYGYGEYLVGSEEVEPGRGWDHSAYLKAMSEDPTMSAAAIGETVADSYMKVYLTSNVNLKLERFSQEVQFSVVDINAAEKTYQSYCDLNEKLLEDSVKDISNLTKISQVAENSTRFAQEAYEEYNTIDLGNYMEALAEYYPDECQKVLDNLDEAVLYHRESGYLSESTGLSIYMPVTVSSLNSLHRFLKYVNDISEDEATSALYYYKISGCLNEKFQEYVESKKYGTAEVINVESLKEFGDNEITLDNGSFKVTFTGDQKENVQSARVELAKYDEDENTLTYYGYSTAVSIDDSGVAEAKLDGKWITMNGIPLYTEVIGETDKMISYRSPVMINSDKMYLLFSYDKTEGELSITGTAKADLDEGHIAGEAYVIDKTTIALESGDDITPMYNICDLEEDKTELKEGNESLTYNSKTKLKLESLDDGRYISSIVVSDIRGDQYYTGVVEQKIKDGKLGELSISEDFAASAY